MARAKEQANEEQVLLRQVVLRLLERQEKWRNDAEGPGRRLHDEILARYQNPYQYDELERLLADNPQVFSTRNRFMFMEPIEGDGLPIPILTFEYDFAPQIPEVSFQMGVFAMNGAGKLSAVGYRFETPEGGGMHNYYHAQPVETLLRNGRYKLPCPDLLSASCPTFVLNAANVLTLLLCLIVSVYGRQFLAGNLQTGGLGHQLKRYTDILHWNGPGKGSQFLEDAATGKWRWGP
jgi:hypothetical protein